MKKQSKVLILLFISASAAYASHPNEYSGYYISPGFDISKTINNTKDSIGGEVSFFRNKHTLFFGGGVNIRSQGAEAQINPFVEIGLANPLLPFAVGIDLLFISGNGSDQGIGIKPYLFFTLLAIYFEYDAKFSTGHDAKIGLMAKFPIKLKGDES